MKNHGTNRIYATFIVTEPTCSPRSLDEGYAVKTPTDRAAEVIEAAELTFANEMGATLNLSPAAKVALISQIAAAIQRAVAEERARLVCVH